jgi:hypothetical protein
MIVMIVKSLRDKINDQGLMLTKMFCINQRRKRLLLTYLPDEIIMDNCWCYLLLVVDGQRLLRTQPLSIIKLISKMCVATTHHLLCQPHHRRAARSYYASMHQLGARSYFSAAPVSYPC